MKKLSIDEMYGTEQVADFMGVTRGSVRRWVKKGELVPTAVRDSKGNKFNPEIVKTGAGNGLIYLFDTQTMKLFLRGRWIAGQNWGGGKKRQPGDEVPEVLRL